MCHRAHRECDVRLASVVRSTMREPCATCSRGVDVVYITSEKRLINDVENAQNPRHDCILTHSNEVYIMHVIGRYAYETNVRFFVRGFSVGASLLRGSCARLSRVPERSGRRLAARLARRLGYTPKRGGCGTLTTPQKLRSIFRTQDVDVNTFLVSENHERKEVRIVWRGSVTVG